MPEKWPYNLSRSEIAESLKCRTANRDYHLCELEKNEKDIRKLKDALSRVSRKVRR